LGSARDHPPQRWGLVAIRRRQRRVVIVTLQDGGGVGVLALGLGQRKRRRRQAAATAGEHAASRHRGVGERGHARLARLGRQPLRLRLVVVVVLVVDGRRGRRQL